MKSPIHQSVLVIFLLTILIAPTIPAHAQQDSAEIQLYLLIDHSNSMKDKEAYVRNTVEQLVDYLAQFEKEHNVIIEIGANTFNQNEPDFSSFSSPEELTSQTLFPDEANEDTNFSDMLTQAEDRLRTNSESSTQAIIMITDGIPQEADGSSPTDNDIETQSNALANINLPILILTPEGIENTENQIWNTLDLTDSQFLHIGIDDLETTFNPFFYGLGRIYPQIQDVSLTLNPNKTDLDITLTFDIPQAILPDHTILFKQNGETINLIKENEYVYKWRDGINQIDLIGSTVLSIESVNPITWREKAISEKAYIIIGLNSNTTNHLLPPYAAEVPIDSTSATYLFVELDDIDDTLGEISQSVNNIYQSTNTLKTSIDNNHSDIDSDIDKIYDIVSDPPWQKLLVNIFISIGVALCTGFCTGWIVSNHFDTINQERAKNEQQKAKTENEALKKQICKVSKQVGNLETQLGISLGVIETVDQETEKWKNNHLKTIETKISEFLEKARNSQSEDQTEFVDSLMAELRNSIEGTGSIYALIEKEVTRLKTTLETSKEDLSKIQNTLDKNHQQFLASWVAEIRDQHSDELNSSLNAEKATNLFINALKASAFDNSRVLHNQPDADHQTTVENTDNDESIHDNSSSVDDQTQIPQQSEHPHVEDTPAPSESIPHKTEFEMSVMLKAVDFLVEKNLVNSQIEDLFSDFKSQSKQTFDKLQQNIIAENN